MTASFGSSVRSSVNAADRRQPSPSGGSPTIGLGWLAFVMIDLAPPSPAQPKSKSSAAKRKTNRTDMKPAKPSPSKEPKRKPGTREPKPKLFANKRSVKVTATSTAMRSGDYMRVV